jgi:hypothetical protein
MAQGIVNGYRALGGKPETYDPRTPPPLSLPEAYALALTRMSHYTHYTNQFHCVEANCTEMTNNGFTGWKFVFGNTNGEFGDVEVYFDGLVLSDWGRSHYSLRRSLHRQ